MSTEPENPNKPKVGDWVKVRTAGTEETWWLAKVVQVDGPPTPGNPSTRPMFGVRQIGTHYEVRCWPWSLKKVSLLESLAAEVQDAESPYTSTKIENAR